MMHTPSQPLLQHSRVAVLLARPWAPRLLATLGIVVMTVGLSVPFASRDLLFRSDPVSRSSETWAIGTPVGAPFTVLHLGRMSLPAQLGGGDTVYSALTLGGLALIPLLWRPLAATGTARVRVTYAVWLVLLTLLAVASL